MLKTQLAMPSVTESVTLLGIRLSTVSGSASGNKSEMGSAMVLQNSGGDGVGDDIGR